MENSNAITAIQQKYAGFNLLMPTSSEVQLNPFYKITVMEVPVDLSENSGDVFKVGSVKVGTDSNGKDIWVDTFSPAKPLLMKLAAAAGIQFDPEHTYGTRVDKNTYKAKAFGAMRMPDGTGRTQPNEKVICLDDEEANFRIEFMDKSIKGITEEKAAKEASKMFKGHWIETVNKWNKNLEPEIREYSEDIGEAVIFKDEDNYQDWFEKKFDIDDYDIPDDEWDAFIKKKVDGVAKWKKAIFIAITTF